MNLQLITLSGLGFYALEVGYKAKSRFESPIANSSGKCVIIKTRQSADHVS